MKIAGGEVSYRTHKSDTETERRKVQTWENWYA